MKYMGSKSRIAKDIVPIIQKYINDNNISTYIEPFVGGANIIDKIKCNSKIASDIQKYLIALYNNLEKLLDLPDFVTKEHYSEVRSCFNENKHNYDDWYIGAIGFLASYNGRFFDGGYAGIVNTKAGTVRNYYDEAKRNLLEQVKNLKNINFFCGDYEYFGYDKLSDCCIYCDIPYANTKQYSSSKNFDYDRFWNFAEKASKNNIVIVSEHVAPKKWECIWEQDIKRTINNSKRIQSTEKLFVLK